jgi:hypothetical protein
MPPTTLGSRRGHYCPLLLFNLTILGLNPAIQILTNGTFLDRMGRLRLARPDALLLSICPYHTACLEAGLPTASAVSDALRI